MNPIVSPIPSRVSEEDSLKESLIVSQVELPPLPPIIPMSQVASWCDFQFTAEQMQEYARAAVLAERDKCADLAVKMLAEERERIAADVDEMIAKWEGPYRRSGELIAAAIRKGD